MPYPNQPRDTPIPPELDRWNWGAFLLNVIWGIGNKTYRAFWVLVPIFGLIMVVRLGLRGNEWAWQNNLWRDEAHFKKTQRGWTIAAIAILLGLFIFLAPFLFLISTVMKNNDAFRAAMVEINDNPDVVEALGSPISSGFFVTGNVKWGGGEGSANLAIPLKGPKGKAKAYLRASQELGEWTLHRLVVQIDGQNGTIDILGNRRLSPNDKDVFHFERQKDWQTANLVAREISPGLSDRMIKNTDQYYGSALYAAVNPESEIGI